MPPRRCCCDGDCLVYTDDFNRADDTDLGSEWNQPDGTIEISSAMAKVTSGPASAYTVFENVSEQMYCSIDTWDEESGDIYEVWVNVQDEDNYHFVRFIRNNVNDSVLEIGIKSGGAETVYKSQVILTVTGTARTINALISDNEFCGWVTLTVDSGVEANTTLISGAKHGGFYANRATIWFDNFTMEKHHNDDPNCRYCACECDDSILPAILNAHLSGTGGRMGSLNCDILLVWDRTSNYWYGEGTCCSVLWKLKLDCDPEELTLLNFDCTVSDGFGNSPRTAYLRTCDPLYLVFGPYDVASSDLACPCGPIFTSGTYTIEITEA